MNNEQKISKMKEYLEKFLRTNGNIEENQSENDETDDDNENENEGSDAENELSNQDKMFLMLLKSHYYLCKVFYSYF